MVVLFDLYEYNNKCRFVLGNNTQNALICIGINPNTATNIKDDNTTTKMQNIIKNNKKYNGFIMLNLYPEIASRPCKISPTCNQQFHQENLLHIKKIFKTYTKNDILACWGDDIQIRDYLAISLKDIYQLNSNINPNRRWLYLNSLTKKGNPRHPLYQPNNSLLNLFDIQKYIM